MRVLITGMAGFIGRWVAHAMANEQFDVVGLDTHPEKITSSVPQPCYAIDILDRPQLLRCMAQLRPEVVIHLAARTDLEEQSDPTRYRENIEGVSNLCEAVRATPEVRRVLFTSTQLVCEPGYAPAHDEDYRPHTAYGMSKVRSEQIVRGLDGGGVEWCIVRPTTVWGPYMSSHYQRMLRLIRSGLFFHSGGGDYRKSYGFVRNVAYQYLRLATARHDQIQGRVFYLADYEPISLRTYVNSLAAALGRSWVPTIPLWMARSLALCGDGLSAAGWSSFPFNSKRLDNIVTEYIFDLSATREICGELPYSFRQGIDETARWYLKQCGADKEHDPIGAGATC
jgi:nucleoside-diphosphate-sugar epimerase